MELFLLQVVISFLLTVGMELQPVIANEHTHCTQTLKSGIDFKVVDVYPSVMNSTEMVEPLKYSAINIELCPNNNTLKISLNTSGMSGIMHLCYSMRSTVLREPKIVNTKCVEINVQNSNYPMVMSCWFPMDLFSHVPVIDVIASAAEHDQVLPFYGKLDTNKLDPYNTCTDDCEGLLMNITQVIFCYQTTILLHDERTAIETISFDALNSNACNDSSLLISVKATDKLEYTINCSHDGLGHVKVLYSINGKFCLKYQKVLVVCEGRTEEHGDIIPPEFQGDGFKTFVIFGVACMIIITGVFVFTVFALQWIWHFVKVRRRFSVRDIKTDSDEMMTLNSSKSEPKEKEPTPKLTPKIVTQVDKVIKREYIKRVESGVSMDGQLVTNPKSLKGRSFTELHRVVTWALLENSEAFHRKKILFFPIPFDSFSRDATDLLKAVLTLELSVQSQCCFDRDVNKMFKTGNRYKWIEAILGDFDRIVVFLCFTKIQEQKQEPVVQMMLDQLTKKRIKPHCKVAFVRIAKTSENLNTSYHGEHFPLKDKETYLSFISSILEYYGKNPSTEQDLLHRMTTCNASKHFLRLLEIN